MNQLPFPFNIPPLTTSIILTVWWVFFMAGRAQLKRVVKRTKSLVVERAGDELKNNPHLTLEEFYNMLLPEWQIMVKKSAWFVTHKTELFPIPATPKLVMKRMGMSEEYVGITLYENQVGLEGSHYKKVEKIAAQMLRKAKNGKKT